MLGSTLPLALEGQEHTRQSTRVLSIGFYTEGLKSRELNEETIFTEIIRVK